MKRTPTVAILGAGIGGLALSAALRKLGIESQIYEQAKAFGEALVALFGEELQNGVQEFRIGLVGHAGF